MRTKVTEHLFMCLCAIHIPTLVKYLFNNLLPTKKRLSCFPSVQHQHPLGLPPWPPHLPQIPFLGPVLFFSVFLCLELSKLSAQAQAHFLIVHVELWISIIVYGNSLWFHPFYSAPYNPCGINLMVSLALSLVSWLE